ncbi:hypothetical protein [Brachybacterium sp. GPGPB12]|uniref:hypothetical protein n=1 Tax=Brachybacterium sp. GPGPB12 TaxID=3023517 RepID=UPI003134551E
MLATGSHAWENELVGEIWTYSLDAVWAGVSDCYADLAREVRARTARSSRPSAASASPR